MYRSSTVANFTRIKHNELMSKAVRANGFVFVGGQTPDQREEDVTGQTRQVLKKIDENLEAMGLDKSHLVSVSIWLKDITRDFDAMNAVWAEWVDKNNTPSRATVEAHLRTADMLVEIAAIAAE
ncbi:TPA: RidA family protein [Pseudomonas putida]|nr:RidA family protein [Pseudomonas putida]HDS0932152.1 RidA family protein [Pseudomonas putida]HDS1781559.1 RidA family protein [Pseudomonas putida]HDS3797155.1 RidA family protein [Pseudomonas putida]